LDGTSEAALTRIREQARIQLAGRKTGLLPYELITPAPGDVIEPERGLATLPKPSSGDLFLDIEGDPYAFEDGFEYLFGVIDVSGQYRAFWSRDTSDEFSLAGEKSAFEALMDHIIAQLDAHPDAHIYHYAPYEPTAMKRLMGRHGTREEDVDKLLRGAVLVDLYRAVRQGLRAGVESYSIKQLEPLYGFVRTVDLRDAGSSMVAFMQWLELGDAERPAADHLMRIEGYNRDDADSNRRLRDWLEDRRVELARIAGLPVPRPSDRPPEPLPELTEAQRRVAELAGRLCIGVPDDPGQRTIEQSGRWLLAQLLSWHRREEKSTWWEFYRLLGLNSDQLVEEGDPIGGLEPVGPKGEPFGRRTLRQIWKYRFPEQDHAISEKLRVFDPALCQAYPNEGFETWLIGTVVGVDDAARTVDIERLVAAPHPEALVPLAHYPTREQQAALMRFGEWVADNGLGSDDGSYLAGRDLLLRHPPRLGQAEGETLARAGEGSLQAARRLVLAMKRGTLAIQGAPGSGKTFTGARMITALLQAGITVGICANSHKVIGHLLVQAIEAARQEGIAVQAMQRVTDPEDQCGHPNVLTVPDNETVRGAILEHKVNLVGGTAWLWSPVAMAETVGALFVDEAGQMSLANALAISQAAHVLVLLGDPQQLDQPLKGTHPPGADRSALAHLLGDSSTMPPDRGLFLGTTWRLHPNLCHFTSEAFYDFRLTPEPRLEAQEIRSGGSLLGAGPRLVNVAHDGNDNESTEEAAHVAKLARGLIDSNSIWIDRDGKEHPITWDDVLVVAPYNAQVGVIARLLPAGARVGTVDKFQGQEAPVSIYSMATSSPDLAPRGMRFLYSRNRLNVATSRARCTAVVVASPDLVRVRARTPSQMRLANALCRFIELADRI
jgi:uncharacterized protein